MIQTRKLSIRELLEFPHNNIGEEAESRFKAWSAGLPVHTPDWPHDTEDWTTGLKWLK